jgi:hypothetical protein
MHRSGTSALAGTMGILGAALPHDLMGAEQSNPKGHFEPTTIVTLHDELLALLRTDHLDWWRIDPQEFKSDLMGSFKSRLAQCLRASFRSADVFVLKDPRICRLLPLWREILAEAGIELRIVSPLRHPLEVAGSLAARNGLAADRSLYLWLRHVLDGEFHSRGAVRIFVHYSELLHDWRRVTSQIQQALGLTLSPRTRSVETEVDAFLDPALRHQTSRDLDLVAAFTRSSWIYRAYQALDRLVGAENDPAAMSELDEIRRLFDAASDEFGTVFHRHYAEAAARTRQILDAETAIAAAASARDQLQAQIDRLRAESSDLKERVRALESEAAALSLQHDRDARRIGELEQVIQSAQREREASRRELASAMQEVAEREADAQALRDRLADAQRGLLRMKASFSDSQGEIAALRQTVVRQAGEVSKARAANDNVVNMLDRTLGELASARESDARHRRELAAVEADRERIGADLRATARDLDAAICGRDEARASLDTTKAEFDTTRADLERAKAELERARGSIGAMEREAGALRNRIEAVERSRSWRATAPFRAAGRMARRIVRRPGGTQPDGETPAGTVS